ncbi:MAG: hypothetical protein NUW08_00855, partial [Candidatus Uhrbacteria bacterium]|nr:hypothetical protein [Candidatus Uhrbacteria bacterium]
MAHVRSFIRFFAVFGTAAFMLVANLVFVGCTLERSALGCAQDEVGDDIGRCRLVSADAGTDAFVAMMDAGVDAGYDAEIDAGDLPDAGPDDAGMDGGPPPVDAGTDAGFDAGRDAGFDACVPRTEVCGNGVDEDCSGADLPCPPLHIDFN